MSEAWDGAAWAQLAEELAAWQRIGQPATIWWRDDDAGPAHPGLERLLALARTAAIPVGLAVVPAWLTPDGVDVIRTPEAPVDVLQHGFAHENHEMSPVSGSDKVRPAECGGARPVAVVLAELAEAGTRLRAAFGPRFLPVLVPPWNRIAPAIAAGLAGVGYRALSTFGPRAAAEPHPGLRQLNCHVDPIAWREGERFIGAAATLDRLRAHLAARRERRADPDEPTGLLTHHRDLSPGCWAFLEELLARLAAHPGVALPRLATLIGPA